MQAEIIAVGTELLLGQIANTNAQIISNALREIGIDVYFHTCVGDNQKRLMEVLETALKRSDIIVLTGGLGPTKDDLTKETVALYLNLPLIVDDKSLKNIKRFFAERGRPFTEKQFQASFDTRRGCSH